TMENLTPMLKQYREIKAKYPDCILFFRLGDFYEMFMEDAKTASPILEVVLTSRDAGKAGRMPMCGVPYHAGDNYVAKLVKAGFKVAICEQVEDPALAKGLVKREVIRVITAGTFIDETSNDQRFTCCIYPGTDGVGLAFSEASSGVIQLARFTGNEAAVTVMAKLPLFECLFPQQDEQQVKELLEHPLLKNKGLSLSPYENWNFNPEIAEKNLTEHFGTNNLKGFGIEEISAAVSAAGALLEYLKSVHRSSLKHIDRLALYSETGSVFISPAACYGLELEELFQTLDRTVTPLGRRMFKEWLYRPLSDLEEIKKRQQAVSILKNDPMLRDNLGKTLKNTPDIEKNLSRLSCGSGGAKDLLALRNALNRVPALQSLLSQAGKDNELLRLKDAARIRELLEQTINPEMPLSLSEGKVIRPGYHRELDELRDLQENGRQWLQSYQAQQAKETGINSLKIGFNNVFGYYIEVTRANLKNTPPHFTRKQTLANAERFVTGELKEFEEKILTAQGKIAAIEREIVNGLCSQVLKDATALHETASGIASLDALYSMSAIASLPGYIIPEVNSEEEIHIKDGRHPVVEKLTGNAFIPNDTLLDRDENQLIILTGPNMAGKSTYIRQTALLVIMAQTGGAVPAAEARIGMVDKIFTRIGAHDEISKGQSTFMVEMTEAAGILNNLSERSLVVLDEIGRGTSTYDGLSLAWAVAEFLQQRKVRTLFATHFHELTALAEEYPGVKNYNVSVKEWDDRIIFLHKIIPGGSDQSYGIYVAKLAGIPKEAVSRAGAILAKLELHGSLQETIRHGGKSTERQMAIFEKENKEARRYEEIGRALEETDIDSLTPLEALNKLQQLKRIAEKNGKSSPVTS
ncbi:MAG: DNA mismatch repair protein MutS, partial [Candidatus Omnitrophica bacterium]|nr:DNA mismatch repair protein MutS [Candidatus Omnitrophota bacterium]MDD5526273.1 DNA mismatch repair protein MutS [Candidatus Omnitrophota bacterium]